jgi:hypothetical protein
MRARIILLPVAVLFLVVIGGVLSAHTSGIVVPPSHAGQTQIAVSVHKAALPVTAKVASPTDLVISAPDPSDGGPLLSATLTSLGNPLAGETVEFYLGTAATGTALCAATTGSDGAASCDAGAGQAVAIDDQGYTAAFEGDQALAASTTTWLGTTPPTTSTTTTSLASA